MQNGWSRNQRVEKEECIMGLLNYLEPGCGQAYFPPN